MNNTFILTNGVTEWRQTPSFVFVIKHAKAFTVLRKFLILFHMCVRDHLTQKLFFFCINHAQNNKMRTRMYKICLKSIYKMENLHQDILIK